MDKKKVADLARACSVSCKKLVDDSQLTRTLTSPAVVLVSLTILDIITPTPSKVSWGQ